MTKSQRPQVFIEKIMPVKLLNQQVYYEHGGNPFKGLHRWYSRASVLASLLPADISIWAMPIFLLPNSDRYPFPSLIAEGILLRRTKLQLRSPESLCQLRDLV